MSTTQINEINNNTNNNDDNKPIEQNEQLTNDTLINKLVTINQPQNEILKNEPNEIAEQIMNGTLNVGDFINEYKQNYDNYIKHLKIAARKNIFNKNPDEQIQQLTDENSDLKNELKKYTDENSNLRDELKIIKNKLSEHTKIGNNLPYVAKVSYRRDRVYVKITTARNADLNENGEIIDEDVYTYDDYFNDKYCWRKTKYVVRSENNNIRFSIDRSSC